jgi:hypothetical protein
MIPRLQVEVSVPRAVYDALGDYHAIRRLLLRVGVLSPQAEDIRWRLDVVNAGYIITYSVAVAHAQQVQP